MKSYRESRRFNWLRSVLLRVIDFFYPIFSRWMPIETYRYAACGGGVTVLGLLAYFLAYNFLFTTKIITLGPISMTRYIAAYVCSFCVSFPVGFFLSKFIVFQKSYLKGRVQLFRYAILQALNVGLNYVLLHFFAGFLGFWATPSQTLTSAIIAVFSYFFQRHISFRSEKSPAIAGIVALEEKEV